jgi:antitoxin CptB
MLENDLVIERFFQRHEASLTVMQAAGVERLMELADNDLLDLLMSRCEPVDGCDRPEVKEVLTLMRQPPIRFATKGDSR